MVKAVTGGNVGLMTWFELRELFPLNGAVPGASSEAVGTEAPVWLKGLKNFP